MLLFLAPCVGVRCHLLTLSLVKKHRFLDNERGNVKAVAALGVTAVHTPDGVSYNVWQAALKQWRENNK